MVVGLILSRPGGMIRYRQVSHLTLTDGDRVLRLPIPIPSALWPHFGRLPGGPSFVNPERSGVPPPNAVFAVCDDLNGFVVQG